MKYIYLFLLFIITACNTQTYISEVQIYGEFDSIKKIQITNCSINVVPIDEIETLKNQNIQDQEVVINKNIERIKSIQNWDSVIVKDLFESIEGGFVKYYYQKNILEKIIRNDFGENGQNVSEYYIKNEKLFLRSLTNTIRHLILMRNFILKIT